jgi:hypothetical protein
MVKNFQLQAFSLTTDGLTSLKDHQFTGHGTVPDSTSNIGTNTLRFYSLWADVANLTNVTCNDIQTANAAVDSLLTNHNDRLTGPHQ